MVVISENVHPKGLNFFNQRKVVVLRDVSGHTFPQIALQVKNLSEGHPTPRTCRNVYEAFSTQAGRRKSQYNNCGRQAWKLTVDTQRFLIKTLKKLRRQGVCTSETLKMQLAREKGVRLEVSTIRKFLKSRGYYWLPRAQKRKYSAKQMRERLAFAEQVVALKASGLRKKLALSMDGCVLPMPPRDPTEKMNFLRHLETHMWRLKSERLQPDLAGCDFFNKQMTMDRAIPLWGGIGPNGFATVLMHAKRKLTVSEWVTALKNKKLLDVAKKTCIPDKPNGPWYILCDNETFLHAAACKAEYSKQKLRIWKIPAKSPDLNPIERFWSYLKRRLRAQDLQDAVKKRPCLGKTAYKARVRAVLRSRSTHLTAQNIIQGYIKTCREILRKGGAASSG